MNYTALGPLLTARNDGTDLFLDGVMRALQWSGAALACTRRSNLEAWQRVIREDTEVIQCAPTELWGADSSPCTLYVCWSRTHCDTGPAMIYASGTRAYCRFDAKHNSRGPAVIYCDGDIEYWERDQLHRHDGPAVIGTDGVEEYHLYGNLHCLTGKAIRWRNDDNPYAANLVPSYFRRDNLPIYPSLSPSYFIHGKAYLSEHDYWNAVRLHNTRLKIESHK